MSRRRPLTPQQLAEIQEAARRGPDGSLPGAGHAGDQAVGRLPGAPTEIGARAVAA